MKRAPLFAITMAAAMATSATAFAQQIPVPAWPAGPDEASDVVVLKDGGAVRGVIMELLPNDHVTVKLPDGRTATIAWSVVHHVEQGAHATQPPPPAATPSATPTPAAIITGSVRVHMMGDADAVLEQDHAGAWSVVCSGACDRDLPLEPMYRINGSGIRASGAFHLLAKPGDQVTLNVNSGSSAGFGGGVTMALLGGLTATVGFWGWYVTVLSNATYDGYDNTDYGRKTSTTPWVATTLIGAAVGTVGLVLAISNEKTKIAQTPTTADNEKRTARIEPRAPTWLELKPAGVPAPQASPIFSLRF